MKKVEYFELGHNEVDALVKEHLPALKDYSFVEANACHNDICLNFKDIKVLSREEYGKFFGPSTNPKEIDKWFRSEQRELTHIINGKTQNPGGYYLFMTLCKIGAIEPGDYLVTICW